MKPREVDARSGNQCDEPGNEIQRFEQDVGSTVCVWGFEPTAYLSVAGQ